MSRVSRGGWTTIALVLLVVMVAPRACGDEIVQRPRTPLKDAQVLDFDVDGVRLRVGKDERTLTWDEVEWGKVDRDPERFDRALRELGPPLLEIDRALRKGDHRAALVPAESLFPRYVDRRSKSAHLVAQALMWGLLAEGRRERAVAPFLVVVECQRAAPQRLVVPGPRRLNLEPGVGVAADFPPIFLDKEAAQQVLPEVRRVVGKVAAPVPPGTSLQVAALLLAAGEIEAARSELAKLEGAPREALDIGRALEGRRRTLAGRPEIAVPEFQRLLAEGTEPARLLARFGLGEARVALADPDTRRDGVIDLLHVPALHERGQPELARAALALAVQTLDELGDKEADVLRRDLQARATSNDPSPKRPAGGPGPE